VIPSERTTSWGNPVQTETPLVD